MFIILCVVEDSLVISCEGVMKYGLVVYVDFYKINCLCICIVMLLFVGGFLVILREGVFLCFI